VPSVVLLLLAPVMLLGRPALRLSAAVPSALVSAGATATEGAPTAPVDETAVLIRGGAVTAARTLETVRFTLAAAGVECPGCDRTERRGCAARSRWLSASTRLATCAKSRPGGGETSSLSTVGELGLVLGRGGEGELSAGIATAAPAVRLTTTAAGAIRRRSSEPRGRRRTTMRARAGTRRVQLPDTRAAVAARCAMAAPRRRAARRAFIAFKRFRVAGGVGAGAVGGPAENPWLAGGSTWRWS